MLRMVKHPEFNTEDLRFASASAYDRRLTESTIPGMLSHSMHRACIDGANDCTLWYRTATQIVLEMVEDECLAPHIQYEFRPSVHPTTGERVFSGVHDSCLLESAYAYFNEPDVTIVLAFISSDATCVCKRRAEHPFYVSLGNLSLQARRSDYAWRLAGCVPQYDHEAMRADEGGEPPDVFEYKRRLGQLLRECDALIMAGMHETGAAGIYTVRCGDGVVRRIRVLLGAWLTDRQEQEV
jgi:hypothetical protein